LFISIAGTSRAEEAGEAYIRERPGTKYALGFRPLPPPYIGDLDLAEERLATALEQLGDEPLVISMQGMLHARRNQSGPAVECVRKRSNPTYSHASEIAVVYAALGDKDQAMNWLEKGYPLRSDARFENLVRRIGLPR